ncbi:MAG: hypothetical protein R6U25_07780, partial [Alkalispirochaeta sp.]
MRIDPVVDRAIRKTPDFPKPGILFYDLTSLLADPRAFAHTVDRMGKRLGIGKKTGEIVEQNTGLGKIRSLPNRPVHHWVNAHSGSIVLPSIGVN